MKRVAVCLLLLAVVCASKAQKLPFKSYANVEGLNEPISALMVDDRGLLWIGTPFGVKWFDGRKVLSPSMEVKAGQLYVTGFYRDLSGSIWVLSFYNGLYRFKNAAFTHYLPEPAQLASGRNSVFHLMQYSLARYLVSTDDQLFWLEEGRFDVFDKRKKLPEKGYLAMLKLTDAVLLLAHEKGLYSCTIAGDTLLTTNLYLPGRRISAIVKHQNQIWVGTSQGLYVFKTQEALTQNLVDTIYFKGKNIQSLSVSSENEIWVSADKVYKISSGICSTYEEKNGLPFSTLMYAHAGTTWFASASSLTSLAKEHYVFHDLKNKGINAMTISLGRDEKQALWLGSYNGVSRKTNRGYEHFDKINGKRLGYIAWMLRTKSGALLAGTQAGVLSLKTVPQRKYNLTTSRGYLDRHGQLWLGTVDGQLFLEKEGRLREISLSPFRRDYIDAIQIDPHGLLWIGYRGYGIVKYRLDGLKAIAVSEYAVQTGFSDLRIRSSAQDEKSNLLFGTRTNGLYVFSTKEKKHWHIHTGNGLAANWVKHIAVDSANNIYLATNKGINILVQGHYENPVIRKLQMSGDGLDKAVNVLLNEKDVVWAATDEGLLEYFPRKDIRDTNPPRVYITRLRINGAENTGIGSYSSDLSTQHLAHDSNIIDLEFAGVDLKREGLMYSYRMAGLDKAWSYPDEHNYISYHLLPGSYTFQVVAINKDGVRSRRPATISFVVQTPLWMRWWFLTLCATGALAFSYAFYRYRIRQLLKVEHLRSRISTDLHDDIGSTLSSISILSEVAIHEQNRGQSKKVVGEIRENALLLMEKMDDIIWSVNPEKDSIEEMVLRIRRFAAPLLEAKEMDYSITMDEALRSISLSMDQRQHLYLIVKEAINNLAKYSDCSVASIQLSITGDALKIVIQDNGKGFDANTRPAGNGLANMKWRAEHIGAFLLLESRPGQGTKIIVRSKIK